MSNYVDYVAVQTSGRDDFMLVIAPAWSNLKTGDEVIVDTIRGHFPAVVKAVSTIQKDDEPLKHLIRLLAGYREDANLKRVISKVVYEPLTFETEEEDDSV